VLFRSPMALSPDGRMLAYVIGDGGSSTLWIRSLDKPDDRPLPSTEGVHSAFWSPDSRSIGFFARNHLKRLDISGGPAITLAEASVDPRGGAWLSSGVILFAVSNRDGLRRIPAAGGEVTSVFKGEDADDKTCWWPSPLSGGRDFLFYSRMRKGVFLGSINGKPVRRILDCDWAAQYAGSGRLLFLRGQVLFAQNFDESTGQLRGEPQLIAEGVGGSGNGMAGFSVSQSGILAHCPILTETTRIVWYDRQGNPRDALTDPGQYNEVRVSPDGRRIAWSRPDSQSLTQDIWLHDLTRQVTGRFTSEPSIEASAVWSPDSQKVLYRSNRRGLMNLFIRDVDGGPDQAVLDREDQFSAHGGSTNAIPTDWSRDGKHAIYTVPGPSGFDLFALPMHEPRTPFPLANSKFDEIHGTLSPDSRWLTFASDETGRFEVYRQTFPDGKNRQQISARGGSLPMWRGDGREVFYLAADGAITGIGVGPNGELGMPQRLFDAPLRIVAHPYQTLFSPSPDGRRFLILAMEKDQRPRDVTVVLNWPELLKK